MRTELAPSRLDVTPGLPVTLDISVTNDADVIDGITAAVEGLDPSWVELAIPVVSLFPQTTGSLALRITMPRDAPAGEYLVVVKVFSTVDATRQSTQDFWLTVTPTAAAAMTLRPSLITGGSTAELDAIITNQGNVAIDVTVTARDDARVLDCTTAVGAVVVAAGEIATVRVRARGPRPWFGQTATRSIVVAATAEEIELEENATFNQKPRIPRGALTMAILAGIIALWATVFMVVVGLLGETEDPTKAVATNFNTGGAQNISITAVAGSVTGTVRAASNDETLERVTVEAHRVKPDGSVELIGSAATDDEGVYTLATLLPGAYKLRFTADGYDQLWFPDAAAEPAAAEVALEPADELAGYNVVLQGGSGAVTGTVVAGESETPRTSTVIVRQLVENAGSPQPGVTETPPPAPIVVETTGEFVLEGLATPGTYVVRVESEGFEPLEFEETLAGGESKVLNTVRLGAAPGSLAGLVTSNAGNPLGGVKVEISSGDFKKEITTPTAGNVGTFVADGLETPATYVLTFTLEGFSSPTVALELGPGEARQGVNATLIGGSGSMRGSVTDLAGNPVGGVAVKVSKGDFVASTSTLTTGDGAGGIGSFAVVDIPTPGTYSVTFEKDGYLMEARQVSFATPGPQEGVDVVLRPALATISGQVLGAGAPLSGATVTLADGRTDREDGQSERIVRETGVATAPAGAWSFTDVVPGSWTLTFTHPNYDTRVVLVTVAAGDVVTRDVDLPARASAAGS